MLNGVSFSVYVYMHQYSPTALRAGAADRVRRGHPWVFKDGLERAVAVEPGEPVVLTDAVGAPLAVGLADPNGDLSVRVFGAPGTIIDASFFAARLAQARENRFSWGVPGVTDAWRWVNGESDRLPGFVIDVYGPAAVLKLDGPYQRWLPALTEAVRQTAPEVKSLLLREKTGARVLFGEAPSEVVVYEYDVRMSVDIFSGQKTGFFLDQRENRRWVGQRAAGRRVLNLFSYTGGFTLAALAGGAAHATSVDVAGPALDMLDRALPLNGFDADAHTRAQEDAYDFLKRARQQGQRWDLIILDPPSLAHSRASLPRATKAYHRLNVAAMQVLEPGGIFCTASCTSRVTPADFQAIVRRAAEEVDRRFQIIHDAGAGADHPVLLTFPEGRYLKFLGMQEWS